MRYESILILRPRLIRITNEGFVVKNSLKTAKTKRKNNMYRSLLVSLTAILLCASVVLAKSSGSGTQAVKLTLKGTGASAPVGNTGADGQCIGTGDPWLDSYACSGPGNCSCNVLTSPTVSGSGLKTVADFFVTSDKGINPATEPAVGSGPNPNCNPSLGIFTVTDKSGDLTTLNFLGVSCKHVTGISSRNPSGTHDKDLLSGGWGISDTPAPTKPISGWGTFTGTVNNTTNAISITLSGWVTTE